MSHTLRSLTNVLLATALAASGACAKKSGTEPAAKPAEGSAAAGSAATGSAAAGSAAAGSAEGSAAAGSAATGSAGSAEGSAAAAGSAATAGTILDVAKGAGGFTKLLAAVEAAGLTATLSGPGPFTVLAPTDEAFAKLPAKDLEALLADKAKLTAVLTYHVVAGKVLSTDLGGLKTAKTVQGGELTVDTTSGVKLGGATVIKADLPASNGVIHVIDTVLLPK